MTGCAVIFLEKFISGKFFCCQSLIISAKPFVETGIRSDESTFELFYGIRDIRFCKSVRINLIELCRKFPVLLKLCNDLVKRGRSHLYRIERRSCRLICKSLCASVPELDEIIYGIIYRRSIHSTDLCIHTLGILLVVDTGCLKRMACSARYGIVYRKACVVEKSITQSDL